MPEAEYTTTTRLPVETVWRFVEEMDNWGGFLRGYQQHTKMSRELSHWVLKGDVGAVSRTVEFEVCIEEWRAPSYVRFTLKGLNEAMEGGGEFLLTPAGAGADVEHGGAPGATGAATRPGFFARLVRRLYQLLFGSVARENRESASPGGASPGAASAEASSAGAANTDASTADGARLVFRLKVTPGGPMGPMVDALMKPLMLPVAEELAEKIMAELEAREARPAQHT